MFLYFISSRANVGKLIIVICSLLVGVDFVADKLNLEWKLHFLEKKNTLYCTQFSPQNADKCILGLLNCQTFLGEHAPRYPTRALQEKGDQLLIQSVSLFKPAGYFIIIRNL